MVKLSVVMSVYNGAPSLRATMDSILGQNERDFEMIVVDDGSTDETPSILASYTDPRIRVIAQSNTGLTRALIRGCSEARAEIIARHDAGDISLSHRFQRQLALMEEGHVLVSCKTRWTSPEGDTLLVAEGHGAEIRRSLLQDDAAHIRGLPSHGSAMFRRDAYFAAGGYREQFAVAQDLDLWIRLAAEGTIRVVPEILYEMRIEPRGISGVGRAAQLEATRVAVALRDTNDPSLLDRAARIARPRITRGGEAAGLYFIGKCLLQQRNERGRAYLSRAIAKNPLHVKAWLSWLIGR
jgi:glycosyltransferase involved in cell wall biosynthesis